MMNINYSNNKLLVKHLKKGNENAYIYLLDTYHEKLCIYANNLCRDIYLAEDIVQNVLENIWKKRLNLNEDYSLKNYLYKSVYNEFINQYRKKNNLLVVEKEYAEALLSFLTEEDSNDLDILILQVKKAIEHLPEKCKKVFILGKQEGLTYLEISEHLNISYRTVENRMSKAFSIIRKKVGDKMHTILFLIFGSKPKSTF